MGRGFLDGVNGALVERGIDSSLGAGVYITPVHDQMPDMEAALRLVETVNVAYGLGVHTGPLQVRRRNLPLLHRTRRALSGGGREN